MTAIFPVPGEPTATIEPGDCALDNPSLRFDDEAFGADAFGDDFNLAGWAMILLGTHQPGRSAIIFNLFKIDAIRRVHSAVLARERNGRPDPAAVFSCRICETVRLRRMASEVISSLLVP